MRINYQIVIVGQVAVTLLCGTDFVTQIKLKNVGSEVTLNDCGLFVATQKERKKTCH